MSATTAWLDRLDVGSPSVTWVTVAVSGPGYTSLAQPAASWRRSTGT
ncbi:MULTISPECIES: hypothetical protein [Streptomyces]